MCVCVRVCAYERVCGPRSTHGELAQVLVLAAAVSAAPPPTQALVQPGKQVPGGLGAGHDVEGGGQGAPLVKVAHPQLGAGKLPLYVCMVLNACRSVNTIQYKLYCHTTMLVVFFCHR